MPWIESHTVLSRHRKLAELALGLRLRRSYTMGHLHTLWHAALEQQEDGDLSSWSDEFIADASDFPGDAPQYVRLLQKYRWLDGRLLHDWLDYAGHFLIKKYSTSNRPRLVEIWAKHGREYGATGKRPDSEPKATLPDRTVHNQPGGVSTGHSTAYDRVKPAIAAACADPHATDEPSANKPKIAWALAYFAKPDTYPDERFQAEEVRIAFGEFEAGQQAGYWMWGRRHVGDWRSAMAARMRSNREKRGGKKPAVNAADALIRAISGVKA